MLLTANGIIQLIEGVLIGAAGGLFIGMVIAVELGLLYWLLTVVAWMHNELPSRLGTLLRRCFQKNS